MRIKDIIIKDFSQETKDSTMIEEIKRLVEKFDCSSSCVLVLMIMRIAKMFSVKSL